ncbi:putative molybdopterin-guanine dinucleotide biosynthesis adapter protein [Halobacillus andaensis]|uniref:Molybdopterin-guanine dinucleotide biosynthesis adapter protein n=1 Tax=Halobacillus andaensis TaxID=1176239 RepID=A0A917EUI8_HALAA|nr:molybdopterin-guanine dinucleotide biosynthesis protein B [Halobacillus andaensis]MBP2004071.1 molybdopterin-guanine dinucleotide biosynthesis protein B [Halobacillus andaensis]GGF15575.1 putative molybdopterin-guanine dinucleotide biosynthesis adapter protein [Halobacillus andaensis]
MRPVVFQIVGYKNSGKTTWMTEMVKYAAELGDHVACLKHHGDPSPLSQPEETVDSVKLHRCGAFITSVTGAGETQMLMNRELSLSQLIDWYAVLQPDMIFVEGFKHEGYPKAVILKNKNDVKLLELPNVQVVFTWDRELVTNLEIPVYHMDHWRASIEDIYSYIKRGKWQ